MSILKEDLAQGIVDCAMELGNSLSEEGEFVEGDIEKIIKGHVLKIQIYKVDDVEKKVLEKKAKRVKGKSSPWLMASFWNSRFEAIFDRIYVKNISGKELGIMKKLLMEYDSEILKEMIKWFMDNYGQLSGYKGGPTLEGFLGWRRSIASLCLDKVSNQDNCVEHLDELGVSI